MILSYMWLAGNHILLVLYRVKSMFLLDVGHATPPTPVETFFSAGLAVAGTVVVVIVFIFLAVLLFRGTAMMSRRAGGVVTLTLASIILISGLWCYALSPMATQYEHDSIVQGENPNIGPSQIQTYYADLKEGERLTGDVSYEKAAFTVRIYNPDGNIIRSEVNVTRSGITVEALESGSYKVEIHNPNSQSIAPFIYIGKETEVPYRPLEPAGQWLSLISAPLFGLGIWAVLSTRKRESNLRS